VRARFAGASPRFGIAILFAGLLLLPTCRTTRHTVARIVTPPPTPTEVFVPPPAAAPAAVRAPSPPASPAATPTPTIAPMRVVSAPPSSRYDRSPGVLYEELVPTVSAVTPASTAAATRAPSPRPTRTATAAPGQRPGAYYEDAEGRPVWTPTP